MILSAQSIRRRCIGNQLITPFHERTRAFGLSFGLSPAGYDIRILEALTLEPGEFVLASSKERFNMPNDLIARVADKSTWARRGLFVQNTVIDPGWCGFLTLELTYHGADFLPLVSGMPIAQIIFELLDEATEQPYEGKYQAQAEGVQPAIFEPAPHLGVHDDERVMTIAGIKQRYPELCTVPKVVTLIDDTNKWNKDGRVYERHTVGTEAKS